MRETHVFIPSTYVNRFILTCSTMFMRVISGLLFLSLASLQAVVFSADCSEPNKPICPPQSNSNETYFFPNPHNCSTYYVCSNGCPIELACPPGLEFNNNIMNCDYPYNASCEATPIEQLYPVYCEIGAVMPNPSDCGSFLFCLGDQYANVVPCPPGTKFSRTLLVCDWESNVNSC